jgi:hypothetical protein
LEGCFGAVEDGYGYFYAVQGGQDLVGVLGQG